MSDHRLRQLERLAASGDPEALEQLAAERRRQTDLEGVAWLLKTDLDYTVRSLTANLDDHELRRVTEAMARERLNRRAAPIDQIRSRPSNYLGDVRQRGLHRMLFEVVANSVTEALLGRCRRIEVTLNEDGSATVEDDCGGMPVDASLLQVLTNPSSGWMDRCLYPLGVLGETLPVVNALSSRFEVLIHRNRERHRLWFIQGQPAGEVERSEVEARDPSTRITFTPDPEILRVTAFSPTVVEQRLRELSALLPGRELILIDAGGRVTFSAPDGLASTLAQLVPPAEARRPDPLLVSETVDAPVCGGSVQVDVALTWRKHTREELVLCYVNTELMRGGGTPLAGLEAALSTVLGAEASWRPGLVALIAVLVPQPEYDDAGTELWNPSVAGVVRGVLEPALEAWRE